MQIPKHVVSLNQVNVWQLKKWYQINNMQPRIFNIMCQEMLHSLILRI